MHCFVCFNPLLGFPHISTTVFSLAPQPQYFTRPISQNHIYHCSVHIFTNFNLWCLLFKTQKDRTTPPLTLQFCTHAIHMKMELGDSFFPSSHLRAPFHLKLRAKKYLFTAIVHLLSIKSVAASNTAGQANAVKSVLNTVIIAPCFINPRAMPTASSRNVNTTHDSYYCPNYLITRAAKSSKSIT